MLFWATKSPNFVLKNVHLHALIVEEVLAMHWVLLSHATLGQEKQMPSKSALTMNQLQEHCAVAYHVDKQQQQTRSSRYWWYRKEHMTDSASSHRCTASWHNAELASRVGLPCNKPQMTMLMRDTAVLGGTAGQHIKVTSQSRDLNIIIKAFPVPLLEEAEGDALARDADPEPLQGLAPLLPCCMPPAPPSQLLQRVAGNHFLQ